MPPVKTEIHSNFQLNFFNGLGTVNTDDPLLLPK